MCSSSLKSIHRHSNSLHHHYYNNSLSCLLLPYPFHIFPSSLHLASHWFRLSSYTSAAHTGTFMEVVKTVYRQGTKAGESIAIKADQKDYSYAQLISSAWEVSDLLRTSGLKIVDGTNGHGNLSGARIGIVAKPSAEFVASVLATWFSGGIAVPLALSYPETELLHVMNDSEVSMVLSTEEHGELMQNVAAKCSALFSLMPAVAESLLLPRSEAHTPAKEFDTNKDEDPAVIIYTSGTTGKPKGVVHTHKGITAQVQMLAEAWGYTASDRFLHCLPLHHVHGLFNGLFAPIYTGATVEFIPKFSVSRIWQRWRESYPTDMSKADDAITVFTGVPTMYSRLLQGYESMEPGLQTASATAARQLRLMMSGSSALPLPVMQKWESVTGHRLLERYGMTEILMALSNPLKGKRKAGTVGKPLLGVEAKIVEDDNNNDDTDSGEICIKSPSLFKEYWKLSQITSESFTDDGYFKTGDAGRIDEDGYYVILGRTSADIMKVGGYKLSALEIESVLLEHPVISECCVLGLPDKDYGEAVTVIIILNEEAKRKQEKESQPSLSLKELRGWARDKLAPYKLPTRLILWDSLPRNAMGKVNKKGLKKTLAEEN